MKIGIPASQQPRQTPDGLPWDVLGILLGIFIVRGVILVCALPPFEGWDEVQHVGYVDHCASSHDPAVFGETMLAADFARAAGAFPQPKEALNGLTAAVSYEAFWAGGPRPAPPTTPIPFYEAQHAPLYYRLVAPVYRLGGGRENLRLSVSLLRLINLTSAAIAFLLLLLWIRRWLPREIALAAAACVIFQPLLLLNVVRVSSDALAFLLGTMVVLSCFAIDGRRTMLRSLLLAVLLPLAVLAKGNNLVLVPLVVIVFGLQFRGGGKFIAAAGLGTVLLGFLAVTWQYFSFNLHHFGVMTPMQEAIMNRAAGRSLPAILMSPPLKIWLVVPRSLWVRNALWVGGWSFLELPHAFGAAYEAFLAVGGLAVAGSFFRRSSGIRDRNLILLLLGLTHAGLMVHAVESYRAFGFVTTNPWYAAVAIPWLLILISSSWIASPFPRAGTAVAFGLAALELIAETCGVWWRMIPFYYRGHDLLEFLDRVSILHPAGLGSGTLLSMTLLLTGLLIAGVVSLTRAARRPSALAG